MSDTPRQPPHGQLWLTPQEGEVRHERVADVALRLRTWKLLTYRVPDSLGDLGPGALVEAPFGRSGRMVEGWCVGVSQRPWDSSRKALSAVRSTHAVLSPALIDLALWISEYYFSPPGHVVDAIVPAPLRRTRTRRVTRFAATGKPPEKALSAKRQAVLDALAAGPLTRKEFAQRSSAGPALRRALLALGLVEIRVTREPLDPHDERIARRAEAPANAATDAAAPREDDFTLTPGQTAAIEHIVAAAAAPALRVFLLFGVPGSGKTEVYVRAIRAAVQRGRQAIVLVPEIALATQVVERFARRFERVAVLHSQLTPGAREKALHRIAAGAVDVVIGTRTAVFAPLPRLGLIVVDEEQESSFKNLGAPFYHARDVAIKRAQIEKTAVVLGSATPSLETWHNAQTLPHYELLRLPERVPGARLPDARPIDASRSELGQTTTLLTPEMIAALRATLERGEQAVLLHNRRGYAAHLRCESCGLTLRCPRCSANLVLHRRDQELKCHRCGTRSALRDTCLDDTCGGKLVRSGLAIQKLEEELARALPAARLLRMDSDEMRKREHYVAALRRFEQREADILIGTQMVAKGLDFPGVRLVGVLEADEMLRFPDFRASEQAFQLLVQVVGRAGRREGESLALLQTRETASPAIRFALKLDYEGFAAEELSVRKALVYPPHARLVRVICLDERREAARRAAETLAVGLRRLAGRIHADMRVHEAEPCIVPRLREMLRWQVVIQSPRGGAAQRLLHAAESEKLFRLKLRHLTIDVDPLSLV